MKSYLNWAEPGVTYSVSRTENRWFKRWVWQVYYDDRPSDMNGYTFTAWGSFRAALKAIDNDRD